MCVLWEEPGPCTSGGGNKILKKNKNRQVCKDIEALWFSYVHCSILHDVLARGLAQGCLHLFVLSKAEAHDVVYDYRFLEHGKIAGIFAVRGGFLGEKQAAMTVQCMYSATYYDTLPSYCCWTNQWCNFFGPSRTSFINKTRPCRQPAHFAVFTHTHARSINPVMHGAHPSARICTMFALRSNDGSVYGGISFGECSPSKRVFLLCFYRPNYQALLPCCGRYADSGGIRLHRYIVAVYSTPRNVVNCKVLLSSTK